LNYVARQANSIKDYAQKDTTPFILPFPWESIFFYDCFSFSYCWFHSATIISLRGVEAETM
jgi:hypothetical protein